MQPKHTDTMAVASLWGGRGNDQSLHAENILFLQQKYS